MACQRSAKTEDDVKLHKNSWQSLSFRLLCFAKKRKKSKESLSGYSEFGQDHQYEMQASFHFRFLPTNQITWIYHVDLICYGFSCKQKNLKHFTHCDRQILWTIFVNTRGVGGNLTMDRESIEWDFYVIDWIARHIIHTTLCSINLNHLDAARLH